METTGKYFPLKVTEGYFLDWPTVGAGQDLLVPRYNHTTGQHEYVAVALPADVSAHAALTAAHGATGAVVGTTNSQVLTNKTLTAPVIATIVNTGTLTLPTSTDTLIGRDTTDTLTNKTLTLPTIANFTNAQHNHSNAAGGGTVSGGTPGGSDTQVQFNDAGAFGGDAGLTYAKTTDILTLVGGLKTAKAFPPSDSTNAFGLYRANGTTQDLFYHSTNGWFGIGAIPLSILSVQSASNPEININNTAARKWAIGSLSTGAFFVVDRTSNIIRHSMASDGSFTWANAAGATTFSFNSAGLLNIIQPVTVTAGSNVSAFLARSGNAGNHSGYSIGRLAEDGYLASVHSAGQLAVDSAVGDLVLRADTAGINFAAVNNTGEIRFETGSPLTTKAVISTLGYLALGQLTSTALLDLAASSTARASLRVRSGVAPTSPNDGDVWYATRLQFRRGSTTEIIPTAAAQASYTQTFSTAARTVNAYTSDAESSAYTGIDNAQGGTPYAQLTDLNALRTAYETLRASYDNVMQVVNALIDDHQAFGIA